MKDKIKSLLRENIRVAEAVLDTQTEVIEQMALTLIECLKSGGKILLCGNGGSAADAQHIAAELVGRFQRDRRALPAVALTTDTSIMTSVANDYGFDAVYVRQVEALAKPGDVLIALSTSGNSANVVEAMKKAREMNVRTIGFTGRGGGSMTELSDVCFVVPAGVTCNIQEAHITVGHILCNLVEEAVCGG